MSSNAKKFWVLLVFAAIVMSAPSASAGLRLTTPDTCWFQSNFIDLPVEVRWVSGCDNEMCSFELEMSFNPRVVQAVTVTGAPLLSDFHWPDVYFDIDNVAGIIKIAGASANCVPLTNLTLADTLLYVGFLVTGAQHSDANLNVVSFKYNEVASSCVSWLVGDLEVCEWIEVEGMVSYCSNGMPVCDADVTLAYRPASGVVPQIDDKTTLTRCDIGCEGDCRGSFTVADVIGGYDYYLTVNKDDEYDDAVTAFDASLVLRYMVNHLTFNCCQKVAADVSGDGCISAYDAALIMKHLVHMAPAYPYFPKNAARQSNWIFFHGSDHSGCTADSYCLFPIEEYGYSPLLDSRYYQDFDAVILGDVSGNWGVAKKMAVTPGGVEARLVSSTDQERVYELVAPSDGVYGCTFAIDTDMPSAVSVVSMSDWAVEANEFNGRVNVAMAGVRPTNILGHVIVAAEAGSVVLDGFVLNETDMGGSVVLKNDDQMLPAEFTLGNAYPNPFNPTTTIAFALPEASQVRLRVFNMLGREVRTLADGLFEAGSHTVMWDATDQSGQSVSTGVYFYRLEAPGFAETKKMMLIK